MSRYSLDGLEREIKRCLRSSSSTSMYGIKVCLTQIETRYGAEEKKRVMQKYKIEKLETL